MKIESLAIKSLWQANRYHNHSEAQCKLAQEVLQKFTFKGHEKVLDIGCGDGEITSFIGREKVPSGAIIGIDSSSSMIECSLRNNQSPNVSFQIGNAEKFSIDHQFDLIVSFSALHWVYDQFTVWNNIRKHLIIGGVALVSLNPLPRNQDLTEAINAAIQSPKFSPFFVDFVEKSLMPLMTINDYESLILETGLKVDECVQSFKAFYYENRQVFSLNLKGWLPHVGHVSEDLQDVFVEMIVNIFLEKTGQINCAILLNYNNFMIKAIRIN